MAVSERDLTISGTTLRVNGRELHIDDTSPEELEHVLTIGRDLIESTVHTYLEKMRKRSTTPRKLQFPSINALELGQHSTEVPVLVDRKIGTGLHTDVAEISPRILPYWQAVGRAALIPEIRFWAGEDTYDLLVRTEPYEQ